MFAGGGKNKALVALFGLRFFGGRSSPGRLETINRRFAVYLVGGPHSFIRRARLICGGTVVEDIDQYNRVHEMFSVLSGGNNRNMDDVSGAMNRWDSDSLYPIINKNLNTSKSI